MSSETRLEQVLIAISIMTVVSGLTQMLAPGFVLGILDAETTAAAQHFFAIVGMFMVLFGGLLLHALFSHGHQQVAVLWAGLQKLGAVGAVALGVANAVFSPLALLVAGFDLVSGVLILMFWSSARRRDKVAGLPALERR